MTAAPSASRRQLDQLSRSQPEAGPWLALVEATLVEAEQPVWAAAAMASLLQTEQVGGAPLLTGATVPLPRPVADDWLRRLLALAGEAGPEAISLRVAASATDLDAPGLLEAAINQDEPRIAAEADRLGTDSHALAAIAHLATGPLLQALRRRFAGATGASWEQGSCPICGAWPAAAESRGLERSRHLRCGRCGADWAFATLRCPFCATDDHAKLSSLVPEQQAESRRIETCEVCRGYVKQLATLRPWAGDEVALADLASVDLDLAALEHDYARPERPAHHLGLRLVDPLPV